MTSLEKIESLVDELQKIIDNNDLSKIDKINLYALEDEWREQDVKYRFWSDKLAKAKNLVNLIEEALKLRKALVDKDVRRSPSKYGFIEKAPGNEAISNIVVLDAKYGMLSKMLIEAKYFVDILFGAIISLEHRRDGLHEEVKLYLSNYYAEPDMSDKTKRKIEYKEGETYEQEHRRKLKEIGEERKANVERMRRKE
jgi:hypothetical protein